ncbi:hypothetical protein [Ulvibacter litoralis]|uniref:Immunity protein 40 n=1 Tax=Ulvibacter litoralis TaxID=227084 RepID=A0A1G7HFL8_9FLAO|nr:hypothetical protein [Ulvibacter litoralis]GHC57671.1 hypothetical protein GCM10008083_22830 [Ulvibacter litoralis]SDE99272.1 hypothetical protein SAMN05421855_10469 [Ulvibacter litoralis]
MTKEEYLNKHIYQGLKNLNTGFDAPSIYYFSENDFQVILKRVEEKGIGLTGIEPWQNGEYFDVKCFEDYDKLSTNSRWYWKAFEEFCKLNIRDLQFAASFYIPQENLISI